MQSLNKRDKYRREMDLRTGRARKRGSSNETRSYSNYRSLRMSTKSLLFNFSRFKPAVAQRILTHLDDFPRLKVPFFCRQRLRKVKREGQEILTACGGVEYRFGVGGHAPTKKPREQGSRGSLFCQEAGSRPGYHMNSKPACRPW